MVRRKRTSRAPGIVAQSARRLGSARPLNAVVRRHGDMDVKATVIGIYTTPTSGSLTQSVPQATLEAGKGLVGDRYYAGVGTFSKKVMPPDAEITLIENEEIERFNSGEHAAYSPGAFRRNIVTSGIRLNDLVGRRFRVGSALLEGKRLCEPCGHLAKLVSSSIVERMVHRAGLRAQVLSGATVNVGDDIHEELTV
jgi:MOSC domain-containing protein YiiM